MALEKMTPTKCFFLFACIACFAAVRAVPVRQAADCVTSDLLNIAGVNVYPATHQIFSPNKTYLQDRTTVQVAENFRVTYYDTYKVVTAIYYGTTETYLLHQCGTNPPSLASLDLPATTKTFAVPLSSVSLEDTSAVYFMKMLGIADRISYVTPYVVDPCMQFLAGSQCNHSSSSADKSAIDAVFQFSINVNKSQAIMFKATADPGPLNRAEYIKFLATFFNREAKANTLFNEIVSNYEEVRTAAYKYIVRTNATRPVIAWLYYSPEWESDYGNAPEQIKLRFAAYRRDFTEDAGARLLSLANLNATYGDGSSINMTDSDFVFSNLESTRPVLRTILSQVHTVIDESYIAGDPSKVTLDTFRKTYGLTEESDAALPFLAAGRVLRVDGAANIGGTNSWFEAAVARPDEVLRNLVTILLPDALSASGIQATASSLNLVRSVPPPAGSNITLSASLTAASSLSVYSESDCPATSRKCSSATAAAPICPAAYIDCSGKLVTVTSATQDCAPKCPTTNTSTPAPLGAGNAAGRAAVHMPLALLMPLVAILSLALLGRAL